MKYVLWALIVFFGLSSGWAEVLVSKRVKVSEVKVYGVEPSDAQVVTSFGPGNIKSLEGMDVVVDQEGRILGVCLVYRLADGFLRRAFLEGAKGWLLKEPKEGSLQKEVTLRVVTVEELLSP